MLEKIKKYKFILLFLLFILFLLINNKVNGTTEQFSYSYNNIDFTINFDNDNTVNTYFVICNKNTGIPERFIYHYSDNSFKYYYNEQGNLVIQKMDNDSYFYLNPKKTGDNTYFMQWGGFKREDLTIDVNKSIIGYSNKPIVHKDTGEEYNKFPKWHIEYYEKYQMYYAFTDWYDVSKISITQFYAYGDHLDYNGDFYNIEDYWDWEGEVVETKEDNEYIQRTGFPLGIYGHYSYLQIDLNDHTYVLDALDFTEETLKDSQYEDCLNPFTHLNLYLNENLKTPTVFSNWIECNLIDDSFFKISFNGVKFNYVDIDCQEYKEVNGIEYTRFYYKIFNNGNYTFELSIYDKNHKEYKINKTFNISSYTDFSDINGSDDFPATPYITAYADTSIIRLSTQTFLERFTKKVFNEDVTQLRYKCLYIDEDAYQYFGDDYGSWILLDVGYEDYDKKIQNYPYYFKTEFNFNDIEDGDKFYFVFYDFKLGCYSNVTTFVIENKTELLTISQNISFNNERFNKLYSFFSEHFGFLSYPFEFIINLLNRVFNIKYEEPILHIPVLKVPTTGDVVFNGFDYNLNSMLNYPIVLYLHNIYLIAIDFILVILFIIHIKNTFEEVIGNG